MSHAQIPLIKAGSELMRRWNQFGEKSVQSDFKGVPAVPLRCHWGAQTCPRELISKKEFGDDGDEMAQWVAGFRSCQAGRLCESSQANTAPHIASVKVKASTLAKVDFPGVDT